MSTIIEQVIAAIPAWRGHDVAAADGRPTSGGGSGGRPGDPRVVVLDMPLPVARHARATS